MMSEESLSIVLFEFYGTLPEIRGYALANHASLNDVKIAMMRAGYRIWHGGEEFAESLQYMGGMISGSTIVAGQGDEIVAVMHYRPGEPPGIKIESNLQKEILDALADSFCPLLASG